MKINKAYCPICGKIIYDFFIETKEIKNDMGYMILDLLSFKCCDKNIVTRFYNYKDNNGNNIA